MNMAEKIKGILGFYEMYVLNILIYFLLIWLAACTPTSKIKTRSTVLH